ncbi:MAG: hypothetical protein ACOYW7_06875 [Nitrospirota bacterium]
MRRIGIIALALFTTTGLVAAGIAEEKQTEQKAPVQQAEQKKEEKKQEYIYRGIVSKINKKAKTIIVNKEGPKGEQTDLAMLFDASKAKLNGYKSLKDMKVGDKVAVSYEGKVGKMYAMEITKEKK